MEEEAEHSASVGFRPAVCLRRTRCGTDLCVRKSLRLVFVQLLKAAAARNMIILQRCSVTLFPPREASRMGTVYDPYDHNKPFLSIHLHSCSFEPN